MNDQRIYMDNAATTAVRPEVLAAMNEYFSLHFGNASSVHTSGRLARKAIDRARDQVAAAIGANSSEVYFTSGGSEADNWALKGYALAHENRGRHIVTTAIEHHAVLHTCMYLQRRGWEVTYLPVDESGLVDPAAVAAAIRPDTVLVSVIFANNEIGTVQPIEAIGRVCRDRGVALHTDAVQAVGHIPVDVEAMHIDMLTLTAHKFGGPQGVGALYIRKGLKVETLIHGGAQEKGLRAGTYDLPGIVGLGAAIELAVARMEDHAAHSIALRDGMIEKLLRRVPDCRLNGHPTQRLPGNVNISFRYIEGESLLLHLDLLGVDASSGSACTSGSLDPSHVLLAIGLPHEIAHGSLRLTVNEDNTPEQADFVVDALAGIVEKLRSMSPLWAAQGGEDHV